MFAVPGWSVSANSLKTQHGEPSKSNGAPPKGEDISTSKSSKKRKRSSGRSRAQDVNTANLADLWETVIEGKPQAPNNKVHSEKRQRISKDKSEAATKDPEGDAAPKEKKKKQKKEKKLKDKSKDKIIAHKQSVDGGTSANSKPASDAITKAMPLLATTPQLTPLQASMRQKLISARFRYLNQELYTKPSSHSLSIFQENPEMFTEYHEGFRRQVEVWPENPLNGYIASIKARGELRGPKRGGEGNEASQETLVPLPRTGGTCNIADLGCGDAALSTDLQKCTKKLHLKIYSFDLQSPSPLVTKADIANLPLLDGSVDIAIFCLALMGTNWIDFIEEAFRILRWKGELWIAEIKSRFSRVAGMGSRVEHSVGNRKHAGAAGGLGNKKEKKRAEEEADDKVAAVEVDGMEDNRQETNVGAFVEVLKKRGFVLKGEGGSDAGRGAVDLSNKMFVKMSFVKGATPIKGKGVPVPKGMEEMGMETWKKKPKGKFIDDEKVQVSSEAAVLKPCVYKLR